MYMTRAQAAAREMRSLRSRLDKAVARASKLQHAVSTGEALVPTDLGVYAGAAAGATSALLGWAGAAATSVGTSAAAAAHAAALVAAGAEPEPEAPPPDMEPVDTTDM